MPYEYKKLEEVVDILDNKRKPISDKERQKLSGNIPYYGANGQVGWINDYIFDDNLILLAEDGGNYLDPFKPNAYTIHGKSWVNNHAHVLKNKTNVINFDWLFYVLAWTDIRNYVSGTTRLKLNQTRMRDIPIPLPTLPDQERIVSKIKELLRNLDTAEEKLNSTERKLKKVMDSALEKLIPDIRSKSELKLNDVIESFQYGTSQKAFTEGEVPCLRMGNIQNMAIDWSDLKYVKDTEEIKKYLLNDKDVLFNRTNSPELVGKTGIFEGNKPTIFAGYLIRLKYKNDLVDPYFLTYLLNSKYAKDYYYKVKTDAVSQSNINAKKLGNMNFPSISIKEQALIVEKLERIRKNNIKQFESIESIKETLSKLRQSILKKAFEGKLI